MAAKKRGPKPKPPAERRSVLLQVRLMPEEKELLERAASILDLEGGASELVRDASLKRAQQVVSKTGRKR